MEEDTGGAGSIESYLILKMGATKEVGDSESGFKF
jgi:hypothetical protein